MKSWEDIKDNTVSEPINDKNWGWNVIDKDYDEMSFMCGLGAYYDDDDDEEYMLQLERVFPELYSLYQEWLHGPGERNEIGLEVAASECTHYIYGISELWKSIPGFPEDIDIAIKELMEYVEAKLKLCNCVKGWEGNSG